jgi:AbrB family looped-hinge helix DNA binding protein
MKTTMDRTGRIVIPALIRKKSGIKPGTKLEIVMDDIAIRLFPTASPPKLVQRGKRLTAETTENSKELPEVDLASLVEEERNRWPW